MMQRTKDLDTPELLEQLPALQQLLFRVLGCQVVSNSYLVWAVLNHEVWCFLRQTLDSVTYCCLHRAYHNKNLNLIFCTTQPQGAAVHNFVIQLALSMVSSGCWEYTHHIFEFASLTCSCVNISSCFFRLPLKVSKSTTQSVTVQLIW